MALSYIRGSLLPALQSWTREFDPQRGFLYRAEFKGLSLDLMEAQQNDFIAQGICCVLKYNLGVSVLEIVDSTQEYTLDDWQLEGNTERVDILTHPSVIAFIEDNSGSDAQSQNIYAALRQHLANEDDPATAFEDTSLFPFAGGYLQRIYSLYQRGTTEFENDFDGSGYVLKHTTNVSNRWQQNIADFNVGEIYTTAELLSEVSDSSLWINPLSARLIYKLSNIPEPDPQPFYFWGWKKSRSTETTAANNRVNITTYYTLALWSTDLYDTVD